MGRNRRNCVSKNDAAPFYVEAVFSIGVEAIRQSPDSAT
jgi:hypothetical protein